MTTKDMFEKAFPQEKQIGGSHIINRFTFNHMNLYLKIILASFRGTL
jgi:hypothetical protein